MNMRIVRALALFLLLPAAVLCQNTVRFQTNLGDIDVTLLPESAPRTVTNFLNYVRRGAYDNTIFHRSVSGFIIQGGGYTFQSGQPVQIPQDARVPNEFAVSNTRGTIAMAKLDNDANSATNQWFFNLGDNSQNLNNQNGGFTVFGRVANAESLAVMDRIAAVPVYQSPLADIPLQNYSGSGTVSQANLITVTSIRQLDAGPSPTISEGGIVTAGSFGGFPAAAPGSYIEIYGSGLAGDTRSWGSSDFTGAGRAPTTLSRVTVTVNGQSAYVSYISPGQVNAQIPSNVAVGGQLPVIVSYQGQPSAPVMLSISPSWAGLLAPASLKTETRQFVGGIHAVDGSYATTANPALPGETLVFYGVGFGAVTPNTIPIAGQIVQGATVLMRPVQFTFGENTGTVMYAGLVQGLVGLYQFNVVVPQNAPAGELPLRVTLGGESLPQTLWIPVGRRP